MNFLPAEPQRGDEAFSSGVNMVEIRLLNAVVFWSLNNGEFLKNDFSYPQEEKKKERKKKPTSNGQNFFSHASISLSMRLEI